MRGSGADRIRKRVANVILADEFRLFVQWNITAYPCGRGRVRNFV